MSLKNYQNRQILRHQIHFYIYFTLEFRQKCQILNPLVQNSTLALCLKFKADCYLSSAFQVNRPYFKQLEV